MKDKLNPAVDALLEQLQQQQAEVLETKKMINSLRRRMGEEPLFPEEQPEASTSPMRPDLYYGKPLSTVAQMYLERRGQACPPAEIMKGLAEGGFDFKNMGWKSGDELRSFALTLGKNSKVFHRLPNGTVGLLEWYPDATAKKAKSEKAEDAAADGGEPNAVEEEEKAS